MRGAARTDIDVRSLVLNSRSFQLLRADRYNFALKVSLVKGLHTAPLDWAEVSDALTDRLCVSAGLFLTHEFLVWPYTQQEGAIP